MKEIIKSVFIIYLIWCLASLGFFLTGWILPKADLQRLEPVSIAAGIILAVFIIRFYYIRVEPGIRDRHSLRLGLLLMTLAVFMSGYLFAAFSGIRSNGLACFLTANLLLFACVLGNWMITPLKRPAEIVPLCLVVALADLFSVVAGPTRHFAEDLSAFYRGGMEGLPPFVDFLLVKVVVPGRDVLMPLFGISDWIIIVFLSAAAAKFNMNDNIWAKAGGHKKNTYGLFFPVSCVGLAASMAIAWLANVFIPALPFVVIVFLCVMIPRYPDMRRLTRAELLPMVLICLVMVGLMVGFY